MDVARFRKLPIIGILRQVELSSIEPLMEAAISSGLETIEITMNTKDATELIKKAARFSGKRLMVGAGTVVDMESLKSAIRSGASFIVMPVFVSDVVKYCVKNKIPVFPGALTPQEIYTAWNAGATMVKVFPSNFFGPAYFKEIKGPFDRIELLACGGVTPENIRAYLSGGASAVAIGASVFKKEWIIKKDYPSISRRIEEYLKAMRSCENAPVASPKF